MTSLHEQILVRSDLSFSNVCPCVLPILSQYTGPWSLYHTISTLTCGRFGHDGSTKGGRGSHPIWVLSPHAEVVFVALHEVMYGPVQLQGICIPNRAPARWLTLQRLDDVSGERHAARVGRRLPRERHGVTWHVVHAQGTRWRRQTWGKKKKY